MSPKAVKFQRKSAYTLACGAASTPLHAPPHCNKGKVAWRELNSRAARPLRRTGGFRRGPDLHNTGTPERSPSVGCEMTFVELQAYAPAYRQSAGNRFL